MKLVVLYNLSISSFFSALPNRLYPREEVVEAVKSQRSRFGATHGMQPKATESCDLLMLALFALIPPNHGVEIRTLELVGDDRDVQNASARKTTDVLFAFVSRRRVVQDSTKLCPELQAPLGYRSQWTLLAAGPVANPQNQQKVTCYENVDCSDALKDSLEAALRHSREQAQKTYDRRTAKPWPCRVLGASPKTGLTKILLGQIQFMSSPSKVSLLLYKRLRHDLYKLNLDGAQWKEEIACLVPVQVRVTKNLAGVYKLLTSTRKIHKQIVES
ncbi:uncharacterized protein [Montipora capricornis]|uniref:uncharacterized protein n=1 Tax=Montipora capricornis TaxID=246305 RepID=UPI0035F20DC6